METYAQILSFAIVTVILLLLVGLGGLVMWKLARKEQVLEYLIADEKGYASMSRFQLLIFTFTIAFAFLYVVTKPTAEGFPAIPDSVLLLLGISGSSFLVGKSLDNKAPTKEGELSADPKTAADDAAARASMHATAAKFAADEAAAHAVNASGIKS